MIVRDHYVVDNIIVMVNNGHFVVDEDRRMMGYK